jgi:hypothetical protein
MIGINIQYPWSELLINENKCVETRSYPLPTKYIGETLALIETPGKHGKFEARIIGTIVFSHSFKYDSYQEWISDHNRHLVQTTDPLFGWNTKPKYGWVVCQINKFDQPILAPKRKGIIFTNDCMSLNCSGV